MVLLLSSMCEESCFSTASAKQPGLPPSHTAWKVTTYPSRLSSKAISSKKNAAHYKTQMNENAATAAKSLQSCPTLCNPIDGSPPGSPVPGILQARTLEWVAISFSNAWKWKVKVKSLSRVRLLATPWTAAYQAPPSMGISRQEYWSGVPLPSPEWKWAPLKMCLQWVVSECNLRTSWKSSDRLPSVGFIRVPDSDWILDQKTIFIVHLTSFYFIPWLSHNKVSVSLYISDMDLILPNNSKKCWP